MTHGERTESLDWRLKPFPELVRLSWPIAVSMLSYSVMTLVDTVFAGRLGASAVGAVGFGGVVTFTLACFGMGVLRGTKTLVSQAVGARRVDRIPGAVGAALVTAAALGGATALVGQAVAASLHVVASESAAVRLAQRYVAVRLLGAPLVLVGFAIREVRCAVGDSQSPMRTALVANALHLPLNFLLIFTAGLGVTGAALSTLLAQGIETALLVWVQRKEGLGLSSWDRRDVSELFRTGLPLGLERLFNVASFTVLVTLVARVSDADLAAHQLAHQVNLFAMLPMMALAEAAAVLAGQAVGANEDALVRRVSRVAIVAGTAYGACCALVYVAAAPAIAAALTPDGHVAALTVQLLHVAAAWQAFMTLYLVGGAVLRGVGDVRFATIAMVTVAWIVTPPIAAVLGLELGLGALGGWLALLVEWAAGALVLGWRLANDRWISAARAARSRLASLPDAPVGAEPAGI